MPSPRLRPAVRAVVADRDDRVLMVRWTLDGPDGPVHVWGTPGGGIEPGESHEDALRRELLEEVGHVVGPEGCGPCVAHRVHTFPLGDWDGQEEWYYLLRVDALTPRGVLTEEELAAENLTATGWHTVAQVRALPRPSGARVAPSDAAAFLERLLADGPPAEPLELGL